MAMSSEVRIYFGKQFFRMLLILIFSACDWIGIRLEAKHAMYQKLLIFMQKKDIYINGLKSAILDMKIYIYRPQHNANARLHENEFLRSCNAKIKHTN